MSSLFVVVVVAVNIVVGGGGGRCFVCLFALFCFGFCVCVCVWGGGLQLVRVYDVGLICFSMCVVHQLLYSSLKKTEQSHM